MHESLIVKANELIDGTSNGKLTIYEGKIFAWLAVQIQKNDTDFKVYSITRLEAIRLLGFPDNYTTTQLRSIARKMHRHVIEIRNERTRKELGEKGWEDVSLVTTSRYNSNTDTFEFALHPDLKPYLLELTSNFTKLDFLKYLNFQNVHSWKFYEICTKKLMGNAEIYFEEDLESFKKVLGIKGKYKQFKDFKKRVIIPVIKDLKTVASLEVEITPTRLNSREYKKLCFIVKLKDKKKAGFWSQLKSFGLSDSKIEILLNEHTQDNIDLTLRKFGSQIGAGRFDNGVLIKKKSGIFIDKLRQISKENI